VSFESQSPSVYEYIYDGRSRRTKCAKSPNWEVRHSLCPVAFDTLKAASTALCLVVGLATAFVFSPARLRAVDEPIRLSAKKTLSAVEMDHGEELHRRWTLLQR
jgi:ABC-type uncharacterized transport system permease subunit